MTDFKDDSNTYASTGTPRKKYRLSAGTAAFLAFNFLMILGFCKFSFYVLKNHRSAVDRDTLVKTYVDVQPYSGARPESPSYIVLKGQRTPAPFFDRTTEKAKADNPPPVFAAAEIPAPVMEKPVKPALPAIAKTAKRPPVIRPAAPVVIAAATPAAVTPAAETAADLDNLMSSGLSLLTESDETLIASQSILQEEPEQTEPAALKPAAAETPVVVAAAEIPATPAPAEKKPAAKKKKSAVKKERTGTHWVDIAQLRRSLTDAAAETRKAETERKNEALLNMNGAKQTAALNTQTATDAVAAPEPAAPETAKTEKAEEKAVKTAVVQDVPFAGTAEKNDVLQTAEAKKPDTTAIAGNSADLWKIARVRGSSKGVGAPEKAAEKEPEKLKIAQKSDSEPAAAPKTAGQKTVIYRNGRDVTPDKARETSLNWLDRQEAAVWTSMSQSDTPSVWSAAADGVSDPDRAKAFRVADEQPAPANDDKKDEKPEDNVVSSLPVRVVGEEQKPEAKTNPLLLPLGTPTAAPAAAVRAQAAPAVIPTGIPQNVNPAGLAAALTPETAAPAAENKGDDGLVNKIFSFFGKPDSAAAVPEIGTGAPAEMAAAGVSKDDEKAAPAPKPAAKSAGKKETAAEPAKPAQDIAPTELRLTFRPDSSEMSAQSVKWVKAFGQRAKKDIQNAVEVRMSNTNPALQEKRFALIRSTLVGAGMEDVQILPVMTDRTPHTIVLRMIVLPEEGYTEYTSDNGGIKERLYYRKW